MSHQLRHDDPLYYKIALKGLFQEAKENGIEVSIKDNVVSFQNDTGEKTSILVR